MKTSCTIAGAALATLLSFAVHASGEGDNAPERAAQFKSTVAASEVQAGASKAVNLSEGSNNGFIGTPHSNLSREAVNAQAAMAARKGQITPG